MELGGQDLELGGTVGGVQDPRAGRTRRGVGSELRLSGPWQLFARGGRGWLEMGARWLSDWGSLLGVAAPNCKDRVTPKGLRIYVPPGSSTSYWGSNQKEREGFDKEEKKKRD